MASFAKNAKALGSNLVLIDMPKEIPSNLKEQLVSRSLPYLVEIKPQRVLKYKLDKYGKFEYIAYSDTIDNSTYTDDDIYEVTRYFDKSVWQVIKDDKIIEQGEHNLGICPIISFGENGVFPDSGEFNQIAYLQKRYYNLESELDEILRGQTFSMLTVNADAPSDLELKLSTDNALVYGTGMNSPSFIAPDGTSANAYRDKIESIIDNINKVSYDLSTNGSLSNFSLITK